MRSCIRFTPLARRLLKFHEPHIPCYVVCTGDLLILSSSFAKNSICFMRLMKPVAEIMSANVLISHLKPFNKPHFHGLKLKQDITRFSLTLNGAFTCIKLFYGTFTVKSLFSTFPSGMVTFVFTRQGPRMDILPTAKYLPFP